MMSSMPRLSIFPLTLLVIGLTLVSNSQAAFAAQARGRVVKIVCSNPPSGYIACRSRPLQTTVDVVAVEVDGSVSKRSVTTNRAGRFRIKLAPRYYVFAARPPELGMPTEPVEITVPPEGVTVTLRVDVGSP